MRPLTVCVHLQQAAEKLLKALLCVHDREYPLTHNIQVLVDLVSPEYPDLQRLRDPLSTVSPYAVEMRYYMRTYTPTAMRLWRLGR